MNDSIASKRHALSSLIDRMESVLVAFSGGIDSTLVLKVAVDRLGDRAVAATAVSPTLPEKEFKQSLALCSRIGALHLLVGTDQLTIPDFAQNDRRRCYHCKLDLYSKLRKLADRAGLREIVDGSNHDDLSDDRPGMVAATSLGVRSPLQEAGLTKDDVRTLAQAYGLSNWDKPAAACLSSRIPRGIPVTYERLHRVEEAESLLAQEGFRQARVRWYQDAARIELEVQDLPRLVDDAVRIRVITALKSLGFRHVTMDLEGYRQGKAN